MHPKFLKAINTQLRKLREMEEKYERTKPFLEFLDNAIIEYPNLDLDYYVDNFGDLDITGSFSKRSDIDQFLVEHANFANLKDVLELSTDEGRLSSGWNDGYRMAFHPKFGSDCELIQVGEQFIPGHTAPIYKMKCEHEHEKAEQIAISKANLKIPDEITIMELLMKL